MGVWGRGEPGRLRRAIGLAALALSMAATGGQGAPSAPAESRPVALLLASEMPASLDVARYLVSEKFDGVRAHWDGQTLRFRSGRVVPAPGWFTERLPRRPLDGELWLGRGRFEALSGLVRREGGGDDAAWREVKYLIFELPGADAGFAQRVEEIRRLVYATGWPQLVAVEHTRVASRAELQRRLDEVVRAGGEGLMLHRADAPYETGRSDTLIKLKPTQDAEATVVAHLPGKGRHEGRMGALLLQTPQGLRFRVGTGFSDAQRESPPPVGALITYTYRGLTALGTPRFASFLRVREEF